MCVNCASARCALIIKDQFTFDRKIYGEIEKERTVQTSGGSRISLSRFSQPISIVMRLLRAWMQVNRTCRTFRCVKIFRLRKLFEKCSFMRASASRSASFEHTRFQLWEFFFVLANRTIDRSAPITRSLACKLFLLRIFTDFAPYIRWTSGRLHNAHCARCTQHTTQWVPVTIDH